MQHLPDANLIMPMRLSKPQQIPLEPRLPFPLLNLPLHHARVRAEFEALSISEPEIVIRFAFEELHAFGFERGVEVVECFFEELGEEEE
jgi:hypothetical protein